MGGVAFLFAGQGAQHPAMGVDLIETSPAAAEVFAIADEVRPGTSEQCRSASKEELSQTENTQPCVFVHDLAAAAALRERGVVPAACAGFSLGEVAALTFAGAFDTRAGFELVCERAALMAAAAERHPAACAPSSSSMRRKSRAWQNRPARTAGQSTTTAHSRRLWPERPRRCRSSTS